MSSENLTQSAPDARARTMRSQDVALKTLLALLLLAPVATEWVEISQRHYHKPVKVTHRPPLIVDPVDKVIKRKDKPNTNTLGKLPEYTARPNRIYINQTIVNKHWDDVFDISDESVLKIDGAKVNRPIIDEHGSGTTNKDITSRDKDVEKINKTKENDADNGNKVVILKDSKTKPSIKPNRIYLDDEYESLEVLQWADLDKLAEADSKEFFKEKSKPNHKPPHETQQEYTPLATNTQEHEKKQSNPNREISKPPLRLSTIDSTKGASSKNTENSTIVANQNTTNTAPVKSVTIIQKHMVAKITKISDLNKTGTEEHETEEQKTNQKITDITNKIHMTTLGNHNMNKTNEPSIYKNNSTSMNSKRIINQINRYENQVPVKSDKVPDPGEIMIQELLEEDGESNDVDAAVVHENKYVDIEEVSMKPMTTFKKDEAKFHEKGTKAPDPDEVMIREILNEEIQKSRHKLPKVPSKQGSVQRLPTSTQKISTIKHLNKKKDKDVLELSTKQPSSGAKPEVKQIGSAPTGSAPTFNDTEKTLEKVKILNTPETKPVVNQQDTDSGRNKLDDRDFKKLVPLTTTEIEPSEATTTEEWSAEVDSKESDYYKAKILLREPAPVFVSKEEFFTESEESVNSNNDDAKPSLEPLSTKADNFTAHTVKIEKDNMSGHKTNGPSDKTEKTADSPELHNETEEETVKDYDKKDNTMQNVVKLLKVVTDIIARNTKRNFDSKVRYLEDLKDTLLANIQHRLEAAFPAPGRRARSLPPRSPPAAARPSPAAARSLPAAAPRGHVDFPSSESALMTISFLTFAVFLIKLVLQVIHSYKSKTGVPTVVAAVGRAHAHWQGYHGGAH